MLFSFSENSKILCTETCFSDRSIRYPRNLRKWGTFSATKFNKNKSMSQKYRTTPPYNLYLQDLISNSPFLLPYISFKTGLENLMLGKMTSLSWSVFVFSSPARLLVLWYCKGEATWKSFTSESWRVSKEQGRSNFKSKKTYNNNAQVPIFSYACGRISVKRRYCILDF